MTETHARRRHNLCDHSTVKLGRVPALNVAHVGVERAELGEQSRELDFENCSARAAAVQADNMRRPRQGWQVGERRRDKGRLAATSGGGLGCDCLGESSIPSLRLAIRAQERERSSRSGQCGKDGDGRFLSRKQRAGVNCEKMSFYNRLEIHGFIFCTPPLAIHRTRASSMM